MIQPTIAEPDLTDEPFKLDYVSTFDNSHLWQFRDQIEREIQDKVNINRRMYQNEAEIPA